MYLSESDAFQTRTYTKTSAMKDQNWEIQGWHEPVH